MSRQQRNIKKTVLLLVAVMVTMVSLFVKKITTPRYLSDIELLINGFVLIDETHRQVVTESSTGLWMLVASNSEEKNRLEALHQLLKPAIAKQVVIVDSDSVTLPQAVERNIPVINSSGEPSGHFIPPFDRHKMALTLSSVITHR